MFNNPITILYIVGINIKYDRQYDYNVYHIGTYYTNKYMKEYYMPKTVKIQYKKEIRQKAFGHFKHVHDIIVFRA